ncbi:MAG: putative DNA binding domain-containing protein [Erysipelotrichaceae bacterium]|nr:putative DNA binding domain-containing protein [Erysipelotrichaceae bacterium]
MIIYIESENTELKEKYNENFVREVVAFLNSSGGHIYLGIDDKGNIKGVSKVDETLKLISDCISDQIEPSPHNEVKNEIIYEDGLPIIVTSVSKGIRPIYCVKKYGFSSKGCLERLGTTCKEMTSEEIKYRYRQQFVDSDYMLQAPAKYAPLSFDMMKILLTSQGMHINENSFEASFNLKRMDGNYNLMAEILADRNMVPLIFVKFSGYDKASISQRSDYGSQSILLGYQKLKDRLIAENICKTDTKVRPRIDRYLYDMDSVNEVLVNMLVHNDWTISEPLVSFYADRIVFTSHGGLPHGVSIEDFFNGVSHPRNTVLMRVFLNMGIVEHTGHGVPTIVKKYGQKAFDIRDNYINVTIPFDKEVMALMPRVGTVEELPFIYNPLTLNEQMVMEELINNPELTYDELTGLTGLSRRTVSRVICSLIDKGNIERIGNNKKGYWKILK